MQFFGTSMPMIDIDPPTMIFYTTALLVVIGALFALFWSREKRRASLLWFGLPFLMGAAGAIMTINPALKPGNWKLKLGTVFIILAYGFAWQMARIFYGRRPLLWAVLLPTLVWLVFSVTVFQASNHLLTRAILRTGLIAAFAGLAAYEFWRSRETEDLPSRPILFWAFAIFSGFNIMRLPIMSLAPMPIGLAPTAVWAVVVYNLATIILVLVVSFFMIALSQQRLSAQSYNLALRDVLTQCYNRRAYHEHMQNFEGNGDGAAQRYALLVLDIDSFKSINDRFGHQIGDKVIVLAAQAAEIALRKHDRVFRMGGEEFACLLPGTDAQEGFEAAERVRVVFQDIAAIVDGLGIYATMSIGVAATDGDASADQVFSRADAALYEAKQSGRNRTVIASSQNARREPERPNALDSCY